MATCVEWLKRRARLPLPFGNSALPVYRSEHFRIWTKKIDGDENACYGSYVDTACLFAVWMCDDARGESMQRSWGLP